MSTSVDVDRATASAHSRRWVTELSVAVAVLVVSLAPALERLRVSGFNSDDVAWLVGIHTWRPGSSTLVLVENTYLLHVPLLIVADLLFPVSPWSLFIVAVSLHAAGLWLIVSFARHAVAEVLDRPVTALSWWHLAIVVGACGAYALASPLTTFANAGLTTRNLEAGLALLAIRLLYEVAMGRRRVEGSARFALIVVGAAVVMLNDPLSGGTVFGPFVLFWWYTEWRWRPLETGPDRLGEVRRTGLGVLAGLAGWQLAKLALPAVGVRQIGTGIGVASPSEWPGHVRPVLGGLGRLAGRDLVRDDALPLQVAGLLLMGAAVASVAWLVLGVVTQRAQFRARLTVLAFVWAVLVTAAYFVSTLGGDQDSFRYVVLGFPGIAVVVAVAGAVLAERATAPAQTAALAGVVALLAVAAFVGVVDDGVSRNPEMTDAAEIVERLAGDGFDRGYSGYWSAAIVTYHSDFVAPVLSMRCDNADDVVFEWLTDLGQYDRALERSGDRTFVIVDSRPDRLIGCPAELVLDQHGEPIEVIDSGAHLQFWLYDRDVVVDVLREQGWPGS